MSETIQKYTIHLEGKGLDMRLSGVVHISIWIQPDNLYNFTFVHHDNLEDQVLVRPEDFQSLNVL